MARPPPAGVARPLARRRRVEAVHSEASGSLRLYDRDGGTPSSQPGSRDLMPQALSNAPTAYGSAERSTNFAFTHKVFQVEGACFALSRDTKEPLFRVFLGSVTAALPLATLCSEFGIAKDSEDGRLIDIVEKSLRFVKEIRPGDSIPRELLDGTASWTVEEHHRAIARSRLAVQLASWVAGEEKVISDTEQLEQLADDPVTKTRMQNALGEVAEKLGIGRDRKSEVMTKVEDF